LLKRNKFYLRVIFSKLFGTVEGLAKNLFNFRASVKTCPFFYGSPRYAIGSPRRFRLASDLNGTNIFERLPGGSYLGIA
jgi:hypothetical protein